MAKLNRLDVATTGKVDKPKNDVSTLLVPDKVVAVKDSREKTTVCQIADYNKLAAAEKAAKKAKEKLKPDLTALALPKIFEHNGLKGNKIITTMRLVQQRVDLKGRPQEPDGTEEVLDVQFKSDYKAVDAEAAQKAFKQEFPKMNINTYAVESVAGSFDSSIWLNADGTVNVDVYDAMVEAISGVIKKFDLRDSKNNLRTALITQKVVTPRSTFHQQRWEDFAIEDQERLSAIFPNSVALATARVQ